MLGITLDNVQEKLWDGEVTTSNSMGSNFYTRALRCAPPLGWRALIQGHGTLITSSLFGVYQENGLQLTKPYSFRKTCDSTGRKWMETWFDSRRHGSQIIWHKTGMSQHCHLTHPHAITWACKYVSHNIMLSETYFPLMCMKYNIQEMFINMPWLY